MAIGIAGAVILTIIIFIPSIKSHICNRRSEPDEPLSRQGQNSM